MLTLFINSNIPKIIKSKCKQPLQQLMSIDAKPSHELQIKIFNEQIKKHNELKIKEINKNKLHENNSLNKYQTPRLHSGNNLSKAYESEQSYPGVVICNCEYECEHTQSDYESPKIERSFIYEFEDEDDYEIEEDCSKNGSADISYNEYTSFIERYELLKLTEYEKEE